MILLTIICAIKGI